MKKNRPFFSKTSLFSPAIVKKIAFNSSVSSNKYAAILTGTIIGTSSFHYDTPGLTGIKSTQQLNVDFSQFENHTFFNSAESKVNVAFDRIINNFPFDGNTDEISSFFDSLTGFEKHVYDRFPKRRGFLHFSGSYDALSHEGTYIQISDKAGAYKPSLSKDRSGDTILGPGDSTTTIEFSVALAKEFNSGSVLFQRLSGTNTGFTIGLNPSESTEECTFFALMSSGTNHVITSSMKLQKGGFRNVCVTFNRNPGFHEIELYQSGNLIATSTMSSEMGSLGYTFAPLIIGSGTLHMSGAKGDGTLNYFEPRQTFSGALDELRIFDGLRTPAQQKEFQIRNVFAQDSLKAYYKFNEPSGTIPGKAESSIAPLVLDSSGHGLHAEVKNFKERLRYSAGLKMPLRLELPGVNPILFPYDNSIINLNMELLSSASDYDTNNPNLITNLIPEHYLLEAQFSEGLSDYDGGVGQLFSSGSSDFPGGGKMSSPQIISILALMWAKFFDEIKMYLDHFGELVHPDYIETKGVADHFLPQLGDLHGFTLPSFYSNASIKQMFEGENLTVKEQLPHKSLKYIQGQIWRRILVNMHEIVNSKGTVHGIKALIRAAGLDPDSNFRFREFGGPKTLTIDQDRRYKTEVSSMASFSGTMTGTFALKKDPYGTGTPDPNTGISPDYPFFQSAFLSSSRYAGPSLGYPKPKATSFVKTSDLISKGYTYGMSPEPDDGLLTSGSWAFEGLYKFSPLTGNMIHPGTQSLARIHITGSDHTSPKVIFNLLALTSSIFSGRSPTTASLRLMGMVDAGGSQPSTNRPFELNLTGVNIFDGNKWHISFGRRRNDQMNSWTSSSYFLNASRQNFGDIAALHMTRSFVSESNSALNVLQNVSIINTSGSFICIGSQSINNNYNNFLNASYSDASVNDQIRQTMFTGKVSRVRFWSKALEKADIITHTRDFKSTGVRDPFSNFNFTFTTTGSWQRLRLDTTMDQPVTNSNEEGMLYLTDFSQTFGKGGATFTGFEKSKRVIKPERFSYSYIDPRFDERSSDNKIRIRSFQSMKNIEELGGKIAPVYEPRKSIRPEDDIRFSVENSLVQALNEDIITMFSNLDIFNNVIGAPELLYSETYPDLRRLRDIYFNRLTRRIKIKEFFEFFKWFDDTIGILIERLVPSRTNFLGVNFIIESHMLERAKFRYDWQDVNVPFSLRTTRDRPETTNTGKPRNFPGLKSSVNVSTGIPPTTSTTRPSDNNEGGGENNETPQWGTTAKSSSVKNSTSNKTDTNPQPPPLLITAVIKKD